MSARTILIIEDNPADCGLTIDSIRRLRSDLAIEVCEDGESALEKLRDAARPLPDLVLLDLKLPGIDGREVLHTIKNDPRLCRIPVCVLTTSRAHEDIDRSYENHSNCYVMKPVDLNEFRQAIQQIGSIRWSRRAPHPTPGSLEADPRPSRRG
jgi:CheY-like chemotaxis protein